MEQVLSPSKNNIISRFNYKGVNLRKSSQSVNPRETFQIWYGNTTHNCKIACGKITVQTKISKVSKQNTKTHSKT